MTTDQLTPEQKAENRIFFGDRRAWGFGIAIITRGDDLAAVPGRFGWDGGVGAPAEVCRALIPASLRWIEALCGVPQNTLHVRQLAIYAYMGI